MLNKTELHSTGLYESRESIPHQLSPKACQHILSSSQVTEFNLQQRPLFVLSMVGGKRGEVTCRTQGVS